MKVGLVKPIVVLALGVIAMGITACGSGGGSTSYLTTVMLAPVGTTQAVTSTVLASGNTSDPAVAVSIQSTLYPGTLTPSPVTIKSTTISYAKTINSPASAPATLPEQAGPTGTIASGSTVAFPFVVASGIFKDNLVTASGFVPGGQKWEYFVTYHFNAIEDFSKRDFTFSVAGGTITFQ